MHANPQVYLNFLKYIAKSTAATSLVAVFVCILVVLSADGCREREGRITGGGKQPEMYTWSAKEKDILYHMSLPAQMTRIFENQVYPFQPSLPNDPEQIGAYATPFEIAANLGIFGADFGYVRIMDQDLETARYLKVIYMLSAELGIPRDFYQELLNDMDEYIDKPDELGGQLDLVFHEINKYLRQTGRDHLTAAILLGGWVESLYLASNIFLDSPDNFDILERIAEQKYSLNYLINHMNNFPDHEQLLQYNLMLKNLKRSYDRINIYYFEGEVTVDTVSKTITAREYQIETSRANILDIAAKVFSIRERLVK